MSSNHQKRPKKKDNSKDLSKKIRQVTNKGNPNFKAANLLAKNIRNEEEKWIDALKRAHGQLKLLNNLEKKTQIKNRKWKTLSRTTD